MNSKSQDFKITVVSNIVFEPYLSLSIRNCFGMDSDVAYVSFEEYHTAEQREVLSKTDLVVVWPDIEPFNLNVEDLYNDAIIEHVYSFCEHMFKHIRQCSNSKMIWFSFSLNNNIYSPVFGHTYYEGIERLNNSIYHLLDSNSTFLSTQALISKVGVANVVNIKNKYRWNAPYSEKFINEAVQEIHKHYMINKGVSKKCLVLDCDNVLWGGILSEDGIGRIKLGPNGVGRIYKEFQRFLLMLYKHGVILAICSKNDLEDILHVFHTHSEMVLKEEHISCFQVNWENKPANIAQISEFLNIGLDSIVFVDDLPFEIEAVKELLPEVTTIQFNHNIDFSLFSCFNLSHNVCFSDIEKRNHTYKTNYLRRQLQTHYNDYDDYLVALEMRLEIHKMLPSEINRISELSQRTNKCTNGQRYTVAEISNHIECCASTYYSVFLSDKFSDLGLVGAFEVYSDTLMLFAVSCRALGRGIEERIFNFINADIPINNIWFSSTGKNSSTKTLLQEKLPKAKLIPEESL